MAMAASTSPALYGSWASGFSVPWNFAQAARRCSGKDPEPSFGQNMQKGHQWGAHGGSLVSVSAKAESSPIGLFKGSIEGLLIPAIEDNPGKAHWVVYAVNR